MFDSVFLGLCRIKLELHSGIINIPLWPVKPWVFGGAGGAEIPKRLIALTLRFKRDGSTWFAEAVFRFFWGSMGKGFGMSAARWDAGPSALVARPNAGAIGNRYLRPCAALRSACARPQGTPEGVTASLSPYRS